MKVLFAVSNEEISESIVKKYQKEYKQIISYKNVYYFNAILKELQKDKSYDRIVISEDLEAFTHTQYDQIDKFIFEKLDGISDEASNLKGNDTPIILICSDRRTKSETMLVKLFGIGIYNAIIGTDRSVEEVCNLINRPRGKKEAKAYYKIDTEDVNYQAESENDVSEMEIQNIVAHYKRLGKNEDRYVDSFNNIAAQYNDTQLRIITKFLPLNVRAVLEEKSPKYQQIMSFNNTISNNLRKDQNDKDDGPSQVLLKSKNKDRILSKPVVIPSSVNMNGVKKLAKPRNQYMQQPQEYVQKQYNMQEEPQTVQNDKFNNTPITSQMDDEIEEYESLQPNNQQQNNQITQNIQQEPVQAPKRGRGRPKKVVSNDITNQPQVAKRGRGRPKKENEAYIPEEPEEEFVLPGLENNVQEENYEEEKDEFLPGIGTETPTSSYENEEEDMILPGLETRKTEPQQYSSPSSNQNNYQNNIYNTNEIQSNMYTPDDMYSQNNMKSYNANSIETTTNNIEEIDLSNLLTADKKIASFVGTGKNGTSFIVNNIAALMSSIGINTAILDTTQNKNSYYIYTTYK